MTINRNQVQDTMRKALIGSINNYDDNFAVAVKEDGTAYIYEYVGTMEEPESVWDGTDQHLITYHATSEYTVMGFDGLKEAYLDLLDDGERANCDDLSAHEISDLYPRVISELHDYAVAQALEDHDLDAELDEAIATTFPGGRIRSARLSAGLTQQQVADAVGVTVAQVSKWETGKRNPKTDALKKLASATGCNISDLI